MASPLTIRPTHPSSNFFQDSSSIPEEHQPRHLREGAMGPHRAHPYQRERSLSPPRKGIDYRSSLVLRPTAPHQYPRPSSRGPTLMNPHRNMPHHYSSPSRTGMPFADPSRIGVDQLVDRLTQSRPSNTHRDPYGGPPVASPKGPSDYAESGRLPGIGSVSLSLSRVYSHD